MQEKSSSRIIETSDPNVIVGMMLAMGCDSDRMTIIDIYKRAKEAARSSESGEVKKKYTLSIGEYCQMVAMFVEEQCDPIDGIMETIQENYDPN